MNRIEKFGLVSVLVGLVLGGGGLIYLFGNRSYLLLSGIYVISIWKIKEIRVYLLKIN